MNRLITSALLLGLATPALAWNPIYRCGGSQYGTWNGTSTWKMSRANGSTYYSGLSNAEVVNAVHNGFQVWSDAASGSNCSDFVHNQGADSTAAYNSNSNDNVVQFTESSWPSSLGDVNYTIAVTYTYTLGCEIVGADQIYNGVGHRFTTTSNPGWNDTDLQSITAHENGHWLGLDHSTTASATMFASYQSGTIGARTLAGDDITGVTTLYPGSCGARETNCTNGADDDGDGRIDCNDSDCANTAACACPATLNIGCDQRVNGDNGGGVNSVQTWACANWETTGPEDVYSFTPNVSGSVTVDLTGLQADLDLFITGNNSGSCDTNQCAVDGQENNTSEQVVFNANAGQTYTIVVDGWDGASSPYSLTTTCAGGGTTGTSTGTSTGTGTGSGTGSGTGTGGNMCASTDTLTCGANLNGSNIGMPADIDVYACYTGYTWSGPEKVYEFTPSTSGMVSIDLTGLSDDLDLFVTDEQSGRCDANTCVAASGNGYNQSEHVQFNATAGTTYMVVIDGWGGAQSSFGIEATCASGGTSGTTSGTGTGTSSGGTSTGTSSGGTGSGTGASTGSGGTGTGSGGSGSGGSGSGGTGSGTGTGTGGATLTPPTIEGSGGCGCSSTGGTLPALAVLPLVGLALLRRRED